MRSIRWARLICVGLLSMVVAAATAQPESSKAEAASFEAMPFRALERESLAPDLRVSLDAQGNAQLLWQGELLAQLQLLRADSNHWEPMQTELQVTHQHWPYFHLDSALLWEVNASAVDPKIRARGYRLRTAQQVEIVERSLRPHSSVGDSPITRVRATVLRLHGDAGPLHVAVFSWGPFAAQWDEATEIWQLPGGKSLSWPLAVVAAESDENLWFDIGQALRAVQPGRPLKSWSPPPLCERCRRPQASSLRLQTLEEGSALELSIQLPRAELDPQHGIPVFSTLRIGSLSLAGNLINAGPNEARYRLQSDSELAAELERELAAADCYVRLLSQAGQRFEFAALDVALAPKRRALPKSESMAEELPKHLSADLLSAVPNPFQEQTQIRVLVPATLDEAFDLNPALRARMPSSAPFGKLPMLQLRVYDVKGKLVRELYAATHALGEFQVSWNGQDEQGRRVAAGAYYVNLSIGEHEVTHRVTLLKP